MAKLSAHGGEVCRFKKTLPPSPEVGVLERTVEYSLREDGVWLKKHGAVIVDTYDPSGRRRVTWGWKLAKLRGKPLTREILVESGYEEVL